MDTIDVINENVVTTEIQDKLRVMVKSRNGKSILDYLDYLKNSLKSLSFVWLIEYLYGFNWKVKNYRSTITIYSKRSSKNKPLMFIRIDLSDEPLSEEKLRLHLQLFREFGRVYNCWQFKLFTPSGFTAESVELAKKNNLVLAGIDDFNNLLVNYQNRHYLELFAHNFYAYKSNQEMFKRGNLSAIIHSTGTGKSLIAAKLLRDYKNEAALFLSPSHYIIAQQYKHIPDLKNVRYMTYAKLMKLDGKLDFTPKFIVLDEFHRCGAEEWGRGVNALLVSNIEAKILGLSATKIRFLDDSRDMANELLQNKIASELTLAMSIRRCILPTPTIISALYTLSQELETIKTKIKESKKGDKEKEELFKKLNQIKINWEKTSGVPKIIQKHLTKEHNKIIVFCEDIEHIKEMNAAVVSWFRQSKIFDQVKVYNIHVGECESRNNFSAFEKAKCDGETVHLLFCIDMLNEGIHIPEVRAVMLLRKTMSPTIHYQQIGRCLESSGDKPVILDLVNNFQNIGKYNFLFLETNNQKEEDNYIDPPNIKIIDLSLDVLLVLSEIEAQLISWEIAFTCLKMYVEEYNNSLVPIDYVTISGFRLGGWVSKQRQIYRANNLSEDRISKLESIAGWDWFPLDSIWEEHFNELKIYVAEKGNSLVKKEYIADSGIKLGSWISNQRQIYRANNLSADRISKLESIVGWSWNTIDSFWEEFFNQLKQYVAEKRNALVPIDYVTASGLRLGRWIVKQRAVYKNKNLSAERISKLESIDGWNWSPFDSVWEESFNQLKTYVAEKGNALVPIDYVTASGLRLGSWIGTQRSIYKANNLSIERILRLESLAGWSWNPLELAWEESFNQLKQYVAENGNAMVPRCYISESGIKLARWVGVQRRAYKDNTISLERISKLESLPGWKWKFKIS